MKDLFYVKSFFPSRFSKKRAVRFNSVFILVQKELKLLGKHHGSFLCYGLLKSTLVTAEVTHTVFYVTLKDGSRTS